MKLLDNLSFITLAGNCCSCVWTAVCYTAWMQFPASSCQRLWISSLAFSGPRAILPKLSLPVDWHFGGQHVGRPGHVMAEGVFIQRWLLYSSVAPLSLRDPSTSPQPGGQRQGLRPGCCKQRLLHGGGKRHGTWGFFFWNLVIMFDLLISVLSS